MTRLRLLYILIGFGLGPWSLSEAQFVRFANQSWQGVIWTWMAGTIGANNPSGAYGTLGTPSTSNVPAGRSQGCATKDSSGNLWLFGGDNRRNSNNYMNDLWRFNPSTREWTWISGSSSGGSTGVYGTKGTPSASNVPSGRSESTCFFDDSGNFWVIGGRVSSSENLNDVWRFNVSTLQWTWMHGSNTFNPAPVYGTKGVANGTNTPGGLERSAGWKGSGNTFWIFGGFDNAGAGRRSDVWRYNVATNEWTWMTGPGTVGEAPVHGVVGVSSPLNTPGARRVGPSSTTVDENGNFWFFGGDTVTNSGNNWGDLWRFNPTTLEWTWMAGSSSMNPTASYGTLHVPSASWQPLPRRNPCLVVRNNIFYVWMGFHSAAELSDFWSFMPGANLWTLKSGSSTGNVVTVSGTQNSPSTTSYPGGRDGASCWVDNSNNVWMFGGEEFNAKGMNELWRAQFTW